MSTFNWQQKEWPQFKYDITGSDKILKSFYEHVGNVTGMLKAIPGDLQLDALVEIMVAEAIKTSEIEGEFLSRKDVVSSIKKNLGLVARDDNKDARAAGISLLMIDVRNTFAEPISEQKLFAWHSMLMNGIEDVEVGKWRTHVEPMQVISGALGKQKVHFEAPSSEKVPLEMNRFIKWFNDTAPGSNDEIIHAPVRAAVAHLYFESIHPFEDGNGRIGRAIAEKALSQGMGRPVMLSLSKTIESKKKKYYAELEKAQRSLEIDSWVKYFVETVFDAQIDTENLIDFTLKKVNYFDRFNNQFNERQLKVIKRMLDEGPEGFQGGLNAGKYGRIGKVSKATATRDLQYLSDIKAIIVSGGGRSTSYSVNI